MHNSPLCVVCVCVRETETETETFRLWVYNLPPCVVCVCVCERERFGLWVYNSTPCLCMVCACACISVWESNLDCGCIIHPSPPKLFTKGTDLLLSDQVFVLYH